MEMAAIDTPALVIDCEAMEHNLRTMAEFFRDKPAKLRPHAKTHKSPTIAQKQIALGAVGITCAKLGEAEVMAEAGVRTSSSPIRSSATRRSPASSASSTTPASRS